MTRRSTLTRLKYVKKMLARDSDAQIDQADVEVLVMAELNYEQSL